MFRSLIMIWAGLFAIVSHSLEAKPNIDFSEGSDCNSKCNPVIMIDLEYNLSADFCTIYGSFSDSSEMESAWKEISLFLSKQDTTLVMEKPQLGPILAIKEMPEIIFFVLTYRQHPAHPVCIAYNRLQDKYYMQSKIDIRALSELLKTTKIPQEDYRGLIRYCRLAAIIRYPNSSIEFISSINELITIALMRPVATLNLEKANEYKDIEIDVPKITRHGDEITVTFAYAKNQYIVRANVKIKESRLIDYKETVLGEMYEWFPYLKYLYP